MGLVPTRAPNDAGDVAVSTVVKRDGGRIATLVALIALTFSAYSLWETSLKQPDVRIFVPPVIQFAAPYNNTNFEVIAIPVTFANEGARTGTVLSMELAVTDPRTNQTKLFYAADFGRWTMEKTRSGAYQPYAPISLAGRASRTETVLFYTRGDDQQPPQLIQATGPYQFKLTLEQAVADDLGPVDKWLATGPVSVSFERELRFYDARAFNNGTIPLYAKDWRSTHGGSTSAVAKE
jgi:hypothetical protein